MATWRDLISEEMEYNDDDWANLIGCTLSSDELSVEFDNGYGGREGKPFTLWTHSYVYFPVVYDGAEWVGSASRFPDGVPTAHQGGG